MAHGKRMSALKYVWKTMIRMSDLWNDPIESTNFISRITGTDRSSAWIIHDQRKDTAKAVSFLAFKHYDPNAWFEWDGSKIQVSILLGTVYRKSDPKELWKTLKNSEYQTFIHSELFIVHVNALSRANPISTSQRLLSGHSRGMHIVCVELHWWESL